MLFVPQQSKYFFYSPTIILLDPKSYYHLYPKQGRGKAGVHRSPGVLYNSIVIGAQNLNAKQQAVALEIVKSLRAKD